ncbi:MAG: DUF983 domain-containing protein [Alphaproteobacteria bacterium]|nr:DUF983 domain-containing protein [Alphaproteobacteria bacterium]
MQAPPVFSAALRCRCPRCGEGRLFSTFLGLEERCDRCGLPLAGADAGDGPAVMLIFLLGFILVPPILLISMRYDLPLWLHAVMWSVVVLGATLGLARPAKALMLALQYRYRPETFGETRGK